MPRIRMTGAERLARKLAEMSERTRNLYPVLEAKRAELVALLRGGFNEGRTPDGQPHAPLVRASRDRTGRVYPRHQTWRRSGRLTGSIRADVTRDGDIQTRVTDFRGTFFQRGTEHMIARPIMPTRATMSGPILEWHRSLARAIERFIVSGGSATSSSRGVVR